MNPPRLRWRRRQAAFAAGLLGALVGLVGPARPAAAAVRVPVLRTGSTLPCCAIGAGAGSVVPYGMRVDQAPVGLTVGRAEFAPGTLRWAVSDTTYPASAGTSSDSRPAARVLTSMPETPVDAVFLSSTSIPVTGPATSGDRQYLTINLTVPRSEGGFTVTMSNAPIQLSSAVRSADNSTVESTGELGPLTISDSRYQSQPGWSVFGQIGDFTSGGHTFSGSYLGWTPVVTAQNAAHDVAAGPAVLPDSYPGLKGGSRLANAAAGKGLGATVLGAAIDLKAPASVLSRSASATITITVVEYAL